MQPHLTHGFSHLYQVFFPIGFMEYKPNLVYKEKPYPKTVEVKKDLGRFDNKNFDHASFYLSDYAAARAKIQVLE